MGDIFLATLIGIGAFFSTLFALYKLNNKRNKEEHDCCLAVKSH